MTVGPLVLKARAGNVDAYTDLVIRYQGMAFAYALSVLSDYQLAEDATQQALWTAYRNLAALREPERFGGWLRGIVRYECLRVQRERGRHMSESLDALDYSAATDPLTDVENQVEFREDLHALLEKMAALPERQRMVAQLYYLGDQPQRAVSEFLGLSVSTVNNRLREAREILRREGVYPMSISSSNMPTFSKEIGKVICSQGQTIDVSVEPSSLPPLLTAVAVGDKERAISAFISQYLDDDVARLIVTSVDWELAVEPGAMVRSHGRLTDVDVTAVTIDRLATEVGHSKDQSPIPTGIKVVDMFAPLVPGGVVALVGEKNVGKLVVLHELATRLATEERQITVLVFLTTPDELGVAHQLDLQAHGPVTAMFVPVADASPAALASSLDNFDMVIAMSGDLARDGHYPAIDPLLSRSSTVPATPAAKQAREVLSEHPESRRAQLLRAYLTQPFFVAESHTGQPGVVVSSEVAEVDITRILEGNVTSLEPESLLMRGALAGSE